VQICEGAEGLREMLLLPDQSKYNLEASEAYIADQKAQGTELGPCIVTLVLCYW